jgi:glycine/D-amino acid oxidase-like deaminating enzyme
MPPPQFSPDYRDEPVWWIDAPPRATDPLPLPDSVDVAIIGSGYTGLSAGTALARAGRSVLILEAGVPGQGASTRNAGNVSRTLKWSFDGLAHRFGIEAATAYYREAALAIDHLKRTIRAENIECQFRETGRYYAAHSPRAYEAMGREVDMLRTRVGYEAEMIPRAEQRQHVGSDSYFGGQVVHGPGYLHGALLHKGLLERALAADVTIAAATRVTGFGRDGKNFNLATDRGRLRARELIIATNAHTGPDGPVLAHLRRRLIPIRTFAMATAPVPPALVRAVTPGGRPVITSHKVVFHIQPTPDSTRLVLGGFAGRGYGTLKDVARDIHAHFTRRFPILADVPIQRCWDGNFAFTFDYLPHIGVHEGAHYFLGCCGTGIPLGTYLGHKLALRVMDKPGGETAFDGRAFPTVPLYTGNPWFLPTFVRYYAVRDALPF